MSKVTKYRELCDKAKNIHESLHNEFALKFGNYIARIMECEYYGDDPYTHNNEKQQEAGTFYVHRTGKKKDSAYKGGTYKGIDITIGGGGILIRSINIYEVTPMPTQHDKHTPSPWEVIEGPCLVVDNICNKMNWSLSELEEKLQLIDFVWTDHPNHTAYNTLYWGARVGLTLKKAKDDKQIHHMAKYMVLPLRSATYIPTKHKETFFMTNPSRTDITTRSSKKYQEEYNNGKTMTLSSSMTNLQIAGYISSHQ